MKRNCFLIALTLLFLFINGLVSAHCDTMDGPVVADAKKALQENNINYVLKWIRPEDEAELKEAFTLVMKVRSLNSDARTLSDRYFFESLVRIHRTGEGVAYTGLKPSGYPVNEKIKAADKAIETGNLAPLESILPHEKMDELEVLFEKVMSLKNFDLNDVEAGRAYIESYVRFFHAAEGDEGTEHEHHEAIL